VALPWARVGRLLRLAINDRHIMNELNAEDEVSWLSPEDAIWTVQRVASVATTGGIQAQSLS